jgi:hypothetical protein
MVGTRSFVEERLDPDPFLQSARYFRQHKNDKRVYYYFVIFINILSLYVSACSDLFLPANIARALLSSGKTVQSFLIVWDKFITKFGHYYSLVQDNPTWQATEPLTTSLVGAFVQAFFIYRLYKLLGRVWPLYFFILGCSMMGVGGAIWLVRTSSILPAFAPVPIPSSLGYFFGTMSRMLT